MKITDEDLQDYLDLCSTDRNKNGSIEILSSRLESLVRELQNARADSKKNLSRIEIKWEDEFLQNNSQEDDMFVGAVNGVRYYKNWTKKEKE